MTNTENGGKYKLLKSGIKEGYHHRTYGHWRENKKHNCMLINLTCPWNGQILWETQTTKVNSGRNRT